MMGLGIAIIGPIIAVIWLIFLLLAIFVPRDKKTKLRAAGVVVGLPVVIGIAWMGKIMSASISYENDFEYFKELCAKQAGDKVHRRVEGVEGILQITPRTKADQTSKQEQFSAIDPYGYIVGDRHEVERYLLTNVGSWSDTRKPIYKFVERMIPKSSGEHVLGRAEIVDTGRTVGEKYPFAETKNEREKTLTWEDGVKRRSAYGYKIVDVSDREMRSRWIAGSIIKIVKLDSDEVIAERKGFVYVRNKDGSIDDFPWSGIGRNVDQICPREYMLKSFLEHVLVPIREGG